jgi:hypothetical protein
MMKREPRRLHELTDLFLHPEAHFLDVTALAPLPAESERPQDAPEPGVRLCG